MKEDLIKVLKKTIEALIKAGTNYDIEELDFIYHHSLQIIMINKKGEKTILNKVGFMQVFTSKKENGDAPLNNWADFNHIEINGQKGHVVITRKVNLTGKEEKIILSIDLVWEGERWQVIREVIFS